MNFLSFQIVYCPYCGEPQELTVDASAGDQHYIEDCQICCRPMQVHLQVDADGDASLHVAAENDV